MFIRTKLKNKNKPTLKKFKMSGAFKTLGGMGAGILIDILGNLLQGWVDEKRIQTELEKFEPQIKSDLAKLLPDIQAYLDEAPGAKIYAKISIIISYRWPTMDPEISQEIYSGTGLESVGWSTKKEDETEEVGRLGNGKLCQL